MQKGEVLDLQFSLKLWASFNDDSAELNSGSPLED